MTFGERITQLRKENGYATRKSFCEKLGIPETTLRNYETDVREPGHTFLINVSNLLNVSTDYILGIQEEKEIKHSYKLSIAEYNHIEKYRTLDNFGKEFVEIVLDKETKRVDEIRQQKQYIESLKSETSAETFPTKIWAYYGKIASAGTSVEFADMVAGTREYPLTEENKNADYTIGVNGDSMEPLYSDGDIVFVENATHLHIGDIGIFQKDNNIYIKQVGENCLVSLNAKYEPIKSEDSIKICGKVLGKVVKPD